jgi:hypothetical protein
LNKQIAGEMGITETTVKVHRSNMMRKITPRRSPNSVEWWANAIRCRRTPNGREFWRERTTERGPRSSISSGLTRESRKEDQKECSSEIACDGAHAPEPCCSVDQTCGDHVFDAARGLKLGAEVVQGNAVST